MISLNYFVYIIHRALLLYRAHVRGGARSVSQGSCDAFREVEDEKKQVLLRNTCSENFDALDPSTAP